MAESHEDEIYSTMFSSLKHPVRRKILRMLGNKPMTFMEMVEKLDVSSPHLTYHLDSLGELLSKMDDGKYKLSSFGLATVGAMKEVEEVHEADPKRRQVTSRWKIVSVALLIAVLLTSALAAVEFNSLNQLSVDKQSLSDQNARLLSYGMGADKVANFLENVTKLDVSTYTLTLGHDVLTSNNFGGVAEETIQYSARSAYSNLDINLRYRNNHFSRYALTLVESSPVFTQVQPNDVLQNAKFTLARYKAYAGDAYLTNMSAILNAVGTLNQTEVTQGNIKLKIEISLGTVTFTWMYSENAVDFQTKGVQMVFQNNILTLMTDGYYLFTVGSTQLSTSRDQAINAAKEYVRTLTYQINGESVSGFSTIDPPLKVDFAPHPRADSLALYPYWYVEMGLTQTYAGGINVVTVGIWADTSQIADSQLLSSST